jgi:hypothetical protein
MNEYEIVEKVAMRHLKVLSTGVEPTPHAAIVGAQAHANLKMRVYLAGARFEHGVPN